MINASLGVASLERFMSVEGYRQTQQVRLTRLVGTGESGRSGSRPSEERWRSNGTSTKSE